MKNQFFNQSHFLPSSDFLRLYKTFSLQNSISFVLWKVNPAKIFKGKAQAEIRWLKVGYLLNVKGYWMLVTKMAKTVTTSWCRTNKFRHQHVTTTDTFYMIHIIWSWLDSFKTSPAHIKFFHHFGSLPLWDFQIRFNTILRFNFILTL